MSKTFKIADGECTFRFRTEDLVDERIIESDKCRGCNWAVTHWYVLAGTARSAKSLIKKGEAGLCGYCYSDMLAGIDS